MPRWDEMSSVGNICLKRWCFHCILVGRWSVVVVVVVCVARNLKRNEHVKSFSTTGNCKMAIQTDFKDSKIKQRKRIKSQNQRERDRRNKNWYWVCHLLKSFVGFFSFEKNKSILREKKKKKKRKALRISFSILSCFSK